MSKREIKVNNFVLWDVGPFCDAKLFTTDNRLASFGRFADDEDAGRFRIAATYGFAFPYATVNNSSIPPTYCVFDDHSNLYLLSNTTTPSLRWNVANEWLPPKLVRPFRKEEHKSLFDWNRLDVLIKQKRNASRYWTGEQQHEACNLELRSEIDELFVKIGGEKNAKHVLATMHWILRSASLVNKILGEPTAAVRRQPPRFVLATVKNFSPSFCDKLSLPQGNAVATKFLPEINMTDGGSDRRRDDEYREVRYKKVISLRRVLKPFKRSEPMQKKQYGLGYSRLFKPLDEEDKEGMPFELENERIYRDGYLDIGIEEFSGLTRETTMRGECELVQNTAYVCAICDARINAPVVMTGKNIDRLLLFLREAHLINNVVDGVVTYKIRRESAVTVPPPVSILEFFFNEWKWCSGISQWDKTTNDVQAMLILLMLGTISMEDLILFSIDHCEFGIATAAAMRIYETKASQILSSPILECHVFIAGEYLRNTLTPLLSRMKEDKITQLPTFTMPLCPKPPTCSAKTMESFLLLFADLQRSAMTAN